MTQIELKFIFVDIKIVRAEIFITRRGDMPFCILHRATFEDEGRFVIFAYRKAWEISVNHEAGEV